MLWEDFINSYWRDWRTGNKNKDRDKLEDPEWLAEQLKKYTLLETEMPNTIELKKLKALRSLLWGWVQAIVQGKSMDGEMLKQLNVYMDKGPVTRRIVWNSDDQAEISLLPLYSGWEQVMAEIAASFAEALLEKEPSRFRICDNPDCLWVYYDDTRNRSKRYCDDKACGNLMKVRRFRARKKAESEGE
ncbi:CGNR zinc finger domain-containing protein [Paenibacillus nitricinens]|uniref:CGNR zinc finger domain-containing protein n=1 Tax=Paenibacillus TaxID=44249 RepID=UPI0030F68FAC